MSQHRATVEWTLRSDDFDYDRYNREHTWSFPGGMQFEASAAPEFRGAESHVNPEEAFVASLSSCHMLTFLALASKRRFTVSGYRDEAIGTMEKNAEGQLAVTRVVLRPQVTFSGDRRPAPHDVSELHEMAHGQCFIANSVKTEVTVDP